MTLEQFLIHAQNFADLGDAVGRQVAAIAARASFTCLKVRRGMGSALLVDQRDACQYDAKYKNLLNRKRSA